MSPTGYDPLSPLQVIDRLEVGPVRLTARRLIAPYTVTRKGREEATELAYRFEEDVFAPAEPWSLNLASMIAAQVALNYGLFCREIVLGGPLDAADRRFLTEAAANTAREIYVKKFLQPNPFLIGPAAKLPVAPRDSYLRSEIVFPGAVDRIDGRWAAAPDRYGVLASGGKDSLLSAGLLIEAGHETHSIFVNESGRHWYTALNAYRHLARTQPETTARVWTSCDRVFSWMLRHLPFVRPDFARVRADDYPIRLWTVAVFLFGALPVLRKRGLGRLVIGDEYDTTRRVRHHGIPHHDGLYDQSRYFDEALTRYYRRKGWPLSQFSLLRPLSELLVQQILVERYPDLQRHQMSCHATHLERRRALPCGRCEKCRRIVAMLLAVGADPGACGYRKAQVRIALEAFARHGVHQESAGAMELAAMLVERGLIAPITPAFGAPARFPEVRQLRFHPECSPHDGIPVDLRRELWPLLLQHARGAVERTGRMWTPIDPLDPTLLSRPYRLEEMGSASPRPGLAEAAVDHERFLLGEMTWPMAEARLQRTDTALLPVGAVEQHGPHLPLDTDAWDAEYLCRRVAERCSSPRPLVLPLVPYGVSYQHDDFPGTVSLSPETLWRVIYDIGKAVARFGIRKLIIVNGHGGNAPTLQFAAQMINRDAQIFVCVDTGETSDSDVAAVAETANDVHAGEVETSTCLATRPHLVDMARAERFVPSFSTQYLDYASERSVEWYVQTAKISSSGVLGDPTRASREKGERFWEIMIEHLVAFVELLKGSSLDDIHEKRRM